jgi:hypothetical protein
MHQCSRVRVCRSQIQLRRFWMLVGGRFSSSEPRRRSASLSPRGASASSSFNKTPAELWPLPPLLPGLDRRPTLDTSGPAEPKNEASASPHHHHHHQQQQQLQRLHNTHGLQAQICTHDRMSRSARSKSRSPTIRCRISEKLVHDFRVLRPLTRRRRQARAPIV